MTTAVNLFDLERQVLEEEAEQLEKFLKGSGEAPVIYRATSGVVSKAEGDGPIEFIMSHESDDRMGDIIRQDGWDLTNFKRNPVMLWGHDSRSTPPIGKWSNVRVDRKSLLGVANFDSEDPFALSIEGKVRRGFLNAVSVGFRPLEMEWRDDAEGGDFFRPPADFKKNELLETSVVSVPAHPKALRKAAELSIDGSPKAKRFIFLPGENFGSFEARAVDVADEQDNKDTHADEVDRVEENSTGTPVDVSNSTNGYNVELGEWKYDKGWKFIPDRLAHDERPSEIHAPSTDDLIKALNSLEDAVRASFQLKEASPVSVDEHTEPDSEPEPEPELKQVEEPGDNPSDLERLASALREMKRDVYGESDND